MFTKIVVGVDGSDPSQNALDAACALAFGPRAALHIINVPRDETTALVMAGVGGYVPIVAQETDVQLKEAGQQIVEAAKARATDADHSNVQTYVRIGDPADQVISLAKEVEANLIVTGRRGLGGIASLFLGSTSQQIAHDAGCACLTVP